MNHARGFSGARTSFSGVGGSGVLEPGRRLTFSENPGKILRNCRARRKILGVICRKFWDFCIIRRIIHMVHQSRREKRRDLYHVTQPRARVNVSCSRAGHKGGVRGTRRRQRKGHERTTNKDQQRAAEGGYQTRVPKVRDRKRMSVCFY